MASTFTRSPSSSSSTPPRHSSTSSAGGISVLPSSSSSSLSLPAPQPLRVETGTATASSGLLASSQLSDNGFQEISHDDFTPNPSVAASSRSATPSQVERNWLNNSQRLTDVERMLEQLRVQMEMKMQNQSEELKSCQDKMNVLSVDNEQLKAGVRALQVDKLNLRETLERVETQLHTKDVQVQELTRKLSAVQAIHQQEKEGWALRLEEQKKLLAAKDKQINYLNARLMQRAEEDAKGSEQKRSTPIFITVDEKEKKDKEKLRDENKFADTCTASCVLDGVKAVGLAAAASGGACLVVFGATGLWLFIGVGLMISGLGCALVAAVLAD